MCHKNPLFFETRVEFLTAAGAAAVARWRRYRETPISDPGIPATAGEHRGLGRHRHRPQASRVPPLAAQVNPFFWDKITADCFFLRRNCKQYIDISCHGTTKLVSYFQVKSLHWSRSQSLPFSLSPVFVPCVHMNRKLILFTIFIIFTRSGFCPVCVHMKSLSPLMIMFQVMTHLLLSRQEKMLLGSVFQVFLIPLESVN